MADNIVTQPCCDVRPCGCADARMVIDHLHAEIERLTRKLDELDYYIEHSSACATRYGKLRDCTCGLDEARRG